MVGRVQKNAASLFILLVACCIIGSFIGYILDPYIPGMLTKSFSIGAGPMLINLKVVTFTLGFSISINFFSVIGLIIGLIIFVKRF
ncbi:hypothetical protein OXPF_40350 [Oxobacter pfennigii]|uniref:DUF4321 domain-containing protein n=1 Tax=Oxobacter pfennigii TaxID=36849 RepID=A0A0P8W1G3_9CLOT|nr:DUF4321 domain-containing protein [Oxobacter pfennigii]KPU42251.1 hypothetical protein OXPF_40350 [Oxobacter pfennigii]